MIFSPRIPRFVFSKKSQIIMYDFILAFVIFIFVLTTIFLMWYMINRQTNLDNLFAEDQEKASYVLRTLVDSSGYPAHWEQNYTAYCINTNCSLGLANKPGIIANDKLAAFIAMYSTSLGPVRIRELLRVPEKSITILLVNDAGKIVEELGNQVYANNSVSVQSPIIINGTTYVLKVIIES